MELGRRLFRGGEEGLETTAWDQMGYLAGIWPSSLLSLIVLES